MRNSILIFATSILALALPGVAATTPVTSARSKPNPEFVRLAPLFKSATFTDNKGNRLPYRYFEPSTNSSNAPYPVILYLHGEDEAGTDNNAQLTTTDCATVWVTPAHLREHPVYVVAPQVARGKHWTDQNIYSDTLDLLNRFMKDHPSADRNRIYIVGFSMGATGLWDLLLNNPHMFAAAMPISGSADQYLGETQRWAALKNTPVILVHAYDDRVVPISAGLNAAAALQAGGNRFLGYGAPTPSFWSPGSTPSAHDAWYTAFEKFEVLYNSLFWGDLGRTQNGEIDPTTLFTSRSMGDGITQVWDYALGTSWVIERQDKAVIIDTAMGHGSIYKYIRDKVLVNKDVPIEIFLTHQHQDHTLGLTSFIGASQVKNVYVHKEDSALVKSLLGPDAGKVKYVKDGDLIPLGGKNVEVIGVPGHTMGSIVMKYENYLFSGDSIGTGYIGVGAFSVQQYVGSVQHLLDKMGSGHYTIYAGHTGELTAPMTEQYVHDLLACANAVVDRSIPAPVYWRSRDSALRKVSTVGNSSITYSFENVYRIDAALRGLTLSPGILAPRYTPEFAPVTTGSSTFSPGISYYFGWVNGDPSTVAITPTVLDPDYRSLTVNGHEIKSGEAYTGELSSSPTPFAITVTAADGTQRTYTVEVTRH